MEYNFVDDRVTHYIKDVYENQSDYDDEPAWIFIILNRTTDVY